MFDFLDRQGDYEQMMAYTQAVSIRPRGCAELGAAGHKTKNGGGRDE